MKSVLFLILIMFISSCSNLGENITNYEECAAAGYPIMESYPEKCRGPTGETFTRILSDEEKEKLDTQREENKVEKEKDSQDPLICIQDVFQCEDGSFVSRDPNNACEFFECPK